MARMLRNQNATENDKGILVSLLSSWNYGIHRMDTSAFLRHPKVQLGSNRRTPSPRLPCLVLRAGERLAAMDARLSVAHTRGALFSAVPLVLRWERHFWVLRPAGRKCEYGVSLIF